MNEGRALAGVADSVRRPSGIRAPRPDRSSPPGRGRAVRAALTLALTLAFALALAPAVSAADDEKVFTPGASRTESPAPSAATSMTSMTLILGVGLALTGGWLVWRNRRGVSVGREFRSLAVDETRSLGNRQFLVVASYEGRKFLLGVCPGRIDLLSTLDGLPLADKSRE